MKRITAMFLTLVMCLTCAGLVSAEPVQETAVSSYQAEVYFTEGAGLALRDFPDIEAEMLLEIPEGTSLVIDQADDGWGHVTYDGYDGWVSLQYTKIVGDYKTKAPAYGFIDPVYYTVYDTEGEGLELRTDPTENASTFGPLADGTVFKAEAQDEDWVYGEHNGHYGWCNMSYLRESTEDEISRYEAQKTQGRISQGQTSTGQPDTQRQASAQQDLLTNPGRSLRLPTDNGYVQAYISHLNENWAAIDEYDWQKRFLGEEDGSVTRAVVLGDVYGDEIPELIYIAGTSQETGDDYSQPRLYIMTYENGAVRTLFADDWEYSPYVGGYYDYYLFRMKDRNTLYFCRDIGDDGGRTEYGRFDVTGDGTLKIKELFTDLYTDMGYGVEHEYLKQGEAISEESYEAQIQHAQSHTDNILMYSDGCGEFVEDYVAQHGCPAMTVDEALTLLSDFLEAQSADGGNGGVTITFG